MDETTTQDKGEQAPRFEDIIEELEGLVRKLEGGELPLEESLAVFERGIDLVKRGNAILDEAEKRIELVLDSGSGQPEVVPFDPDTGATG